MDKILIAVDIQNDFVTGSLGTEEARAALPAAVRKISEFSGKIYMTKDTHYSDYLTTAEGRALPVEHCIKGTPGHDLAPEIACLENVKNARTVEKNTFGSRQLADILIEECKNAPIRSIELIGLCTDICVVSNALIIKAALPEVHITVDAGCCAGVTPQKHRAALEVLESCQIEVINK